MVWQGEGMFPFALGTNFREPKSTYMYINMESCIPNLVLPAAFFKNLEKATTGFCNKFTEILLGLLVSKITQRNIVFLYIPAVQQTLNIPHSRNRSSYIPPFLFLFFFPFFLKEYLLLLVKFAHN